MKKNQLIVLDRNGEFLCPDLNSHITEKYKSDNLMEKSWLPYLIMVICAAVDGACFTTLFQLISYDSPLLLIFQVIGFLFAFDVVPIYAGIHFRKLKQKLTNDKFILWIAITVFAVAFLMNVILRLMTMDILVPDPSSASMGFGMASHETEASNISATALSLTLVGIVIPFVTSLGSFFISYILSNPILSKKKKLEKLITIKNDEIRRIEAILSEYEADEAFIDHLASNDDGKFYETIKFELAKLLSYCEYTRGQIKAYLAHPVANRVLSEEVGDKLLERIDRELVALEIISERVHTEEVKNIK